jgi:hypothetical protein
MTAGIHRKALYKLHLHYDSGEHTERTGTPLMGGSFWISVLMPGGSLLRAWVLNP